MNEPRESMEFDVVIVGAGPAGLAAAIRLKQANADLSVVVLEKGAEVGAHILSGAVVDPVGIDKLIPDWRDDPDHPFKTEVKEDQFLFLGPAGSVRLPNFLMPPLMNNHGNYIVSLGNVCRWLAARAEALGVEIYPGFAASEVLYNEDGSVKGVATGDMGVEKDGTPGPMFARGMELHGKYTLIGEGVRGSLAKQLIANFGLDARATFRNSASASRNSGRSSRTSTARGWCSTPSAGRSISRPAAVLSSIIWRTISSRSASFSTSTTRTPISIPFEEFQRFKTHPAIRDTFEGGKRISYGARAITEGGWQSVPKVSFPGGALIGCSAGFVNVPRIKGSHNAMLSGILAADTIAEAIAAGKANDDALDAYENEWRGSEIGKDLKRVRNVKPLWSRFGTALGVGIGGIDMWINQITGGWSPLGTLDTASRTTLRPTKASKFKPIAYPKPDGVLTFDRLSSVFLSNTNHEEDQPVHLKVKDMDLQKVLGIC
jgi:electron-transferring-flavoprotein dehydrogenase